MQIDGETLRRDNKKERKIQCTILANQSAKQSAEETVRLARELIRGTVGEALESKNIRPKWKLRRQTRTEK